LHHRVGGALKDEFSCVALAIVADDAFLPVPVEQFDLRSKRLKIRCGDTGAEQFSE
jgi:hypothetical protein